MITAIERENHKEELCPYRENVSCDHPYCCGECEIFAQYIEEMGEIK